MLELKNLCGAYRHANVINGITATFPSGMITSIIGANGSGKSTLLKLCCGLLTPTGGEVLFDGAPLASLSRKERARRISYLPQNVDLPPISVSTLVAHGRFPYLGYPRILTDKDKAFVAKALEMTSLTELSEKPITELSGGQLQRARLAMLLASDTDLLLLDEPLTFLDIRYQLDLLGLITSLKNSGKTVIIVMHDLAHAMNCSDRVALMDSGNLIAVGTPEQIACSDQLRSALGVSPSRASDGRWYV